MNKYKLNLIVCLLAFLAILTIYYVYPQHVIFILAMIYVGAYYIGKNDINNKIIKKILEIISASLFLVIICIGIFFILTFIADIAVSLNTMSIESFGSIFMIVSIYFIFRIGIDAYLDYKKKVFNFSLLLKIISLAVINLVILRLLISKLFFELDTSLFVDQNGFYFIMMLLACMISSLDFNKKVRITKEDILKIIIAIVVSLSAISLLDTLNIYSSSDEYQPIICLYHTHSKEKSTYYAFGYSVTYYYGDSPKIEYRLFNLIPIDRK